MSNSPQAVALEILKSVPLIDGHNDFPHLLRAYYGNKLNALLQPGKHLAGHVDHDRILKGRSGGVFLSAFMPCDPATGNEKQREIRSDIVRDTLQQIDLIHRMLGIYSSTWELVSSAGDFERIFQKGKWACLIAIEGLHQIGDSASVLRMYHHLGVRCMTLVHNWHNAFADSCTQDPPAHGGLSREGKKIVVEMNQMGILIDLSHASQQTAVATLRLSRAPVAFTHSSAAALVPNPRNVPDTILHLLKANNGIIMISFIPSLTSLDPNTASVSHVVDHITYVGEKIGFEHVGIGSDFDGMARGVRGLEDVGAFPRLVEEMVMRGMRNLDVESVLGRNIVRVLRDVEAFAKEQNAETPVLEDEVKPLWDREVIEYVESIYPEAEKCIFK